MKKFFLIALALLLVSGCTYTISEKTTEAMTVKEFADTASIAGTYVVKGYVLSAEVCPECPEGSQCKPCAPDSITIADKLGDIEAGSTGMVGGIETEQAASLTVGKQYVFTVVVTTETSASGDRKITLINVAE